MKTTTVINLIILDESGSMNSIKNPIIEGLNGLMKTIKATENEFPEQFHRISFVTFNSNGINNRIDFMPVRDLEFDEVIDYQPNARTPLYDAICMSVLRVKSMLEKLEDARVLVTILTDGLENDSKEFKHKHVKKLISQLKPKGWTFTFIGADFDVMKVSKDIRIVNYYVFEKTEEGVSQLFDKEVIARKQYIKKIHEGKDASENYFD